MSNQKDFKEKNPVNIVELKDIKKTFNKGYVNQVELFNNFNLTIQKGSFTTVVGSNGSGKTSLLNIICGNISIDQGYIFLNGEDINHYKEYQRAKKIGRVFQDPSLGTCPQLTILENLSLAYNKNKAFSLSPAISKRNIEFFGSQLKLLEMGLENKMTQKVATLSGGQRQALALLISTLTPIDLLILDEHTAALDPKSSETIMALTDSFIKSKKITTLMVTHNLRYAVDYGDRIIMMHQGDMVVDAKEREKENYQIEDLLKIFNSISIECGN